MELEGDRLSTGERRLAAQLSELGVSPSPEQRTAIMCAEQAWQQCHRGLISDFVKARGVEVMHILGRGRTELHPWTAAAHLVNGELSYAATAEPDQQGFEF